MYNADDASPRLTSLEPGIAPHPSGHTMLLLLKFVESDIWRTIPNIKTILSLIAFALAVVLGVMLAWLKSKRKNIPVAFWFVLPALILIGGVVTIYKPADIYRVGVTVVDQMGTPVVDPLGRPPDDLKVWASIKAAPQPVPGGWEFDIPYSIKPADSKLVIRASRENSFLTGEVELVLGDDLNPTVKLTLREDESAEVGGQVVDYKNIAVVGARVYRVGHDADAVVTKEGGNFVLPARAAPNKQILLHAEKKGYGGTDLWWPAGDKQAKLVLER